MESAIGLSLLYLVIILASASSQVAPSNVDCTGVPAGTHMWGCKAYHECRADGSSAYVECGWGMVYNELTRNCEQASTVGTPCGRSYRRECRDYGPPFGKIAVKDFIDTQTGLPCQYFFTCANGHFYGTQKCEGFQVFNEILQYCVKPDAAPSSCNPFGPQVANVEKEVKRHWWKSDTAGGKRKEFLKEPWWKAKRADNSVKRSFLRQKHWLTSSAAAKNRLNYPKVEKMLVKNKNEAQDVSPFQKKGSKTENKANNFKEKAVRTKSKVVPSRRNKSKFYGRRPVYARRKPSKGKLFSTRRVTEGTVSSTTSPRSTRSKTTNTQSKPTTEKPSKKTTTAKRTTVPTTVTTSTTAKATAITSLNNTTTPSDKTESRNANHPWSSNDKAAPRGIAPRNISQRKSQS